jgi:HAD superfamily hydrolase (TIGR01662 family)
MLYCFDLDGTIISSYLDNSDKNYHTWHLLPGRRERLLKLVSQGNRIAIATNQAGVAYGYIKEYDFFIKIGKVFYKLGVTMPYYVCFAHPDSELVSDSGFPYNDPIQVARRKPSGAMIHEAMRELNYAPVETVYIGDLDSDRLAAENAGVTFLYANEFFK